MKTFEEIYNEMQNSDNKVNSSWKKAEGERKKKRNISIITILILDIVLLIYYVPKIFTNSSFMYGEMLAIRILVIIFSLVIVDTFIFIIISVFNNKYLKEYIREYKENIITKLINNFYSEVEYFPAKEIPEYLYEEGEYNETYDEYISEDYIEAQLNNKYSVQMAEVETVDVRTEENSDGNTRTTRITKFNGLFAKIIIDKSIESKLKIFLNGNFLKKQQLKMDSSEFEKYFDVEASNKIIGMQLLTADVMEELVDFENKTNIKYEITIKNNNIYIRFHCGDMFEPKNIKKGAINQKEVKEYFYMLNFTYNLTNKLIKIINDIEI